MLSKLRVGKHSEVWGWEEKLKQSSISKHFAPIDQGAPVAKLIIYGAKNGILVGLCLALS